MQGNAKWVLPSIPALRDPHKGMLSSYAGAQRWAPDNLLEKSTLLAPPIPCHPPQSWSLPTEALKSPSQVKYAALKNTLHSRSALAHLTSLFRDSILLLIQPQIPFVLCTTGGSPKCSSSCYCTVSHLLAFAGAVLAA